MNPQVLARSAVSVSQEIKQAGITDQIDDEELSSVKSSVVIIRWVSIFFCLVCWYGIYAAVKLLLSFWS
jgi:hypothetical protein